MILASPTNWFDIGALDDIPRRGARCVTTPQGRIGVFRTADDRVFAVEDHCPHRAGPLSQGIVHGTSVTCPLHNWVISLETGRAEGADEGSVATIPVRVASGRLELALGLALMAAE
jgi:nitrite reductase (NADH) small subunit